MSPPQFPIARDGNWDYFLRSLPLRILYNLRLLFSNKIFQTNAVTGTQQSISIVNALDEIGMNRKRIPLFCCRLIWLQLSFLQLAYAAVSATHRERLRELIAGGVLSQKKTTARKRVPLPLYSLNKQNQSRDSNKKWPPPHRYGQFV